LSAGPSGSVSAGGGIVPWRGRRPGDLPAQFGVAGRLSLGVEQAAPRRRQLVEDRLREIAVPAQLVRPHVGHPLVGGVLNHVGIALENRQPQQSI